MSSDSKKKRIQHPRIYVGRYALNNALRSISDEHRATLAANTVRSWPDDFELFPTDDVKVILAGVSVEWRENKNEKAKKAEAQPA